MSQIIPTIGRVVHYRLNEHDVNVIRARRDIVAVGTPRTKPTALYAAEPVAFRQHIGNEVKVGEVFPATIVRVFGETPQAPCNLQVHLDGNDTHWATSRSVGEGEGTFSWPSLVVTSQQVHDAGQKTLAAMNASH